MNLSSVMDRTAADWKIQFQEELNNMPEKHRDDCPAEEDLLALAQNRLNASKRRAVLSHLDHCDACLSEFGLVQDFLRAENRAVSGLISPGDTPEPRERKSRAGRLQKWKEAWILPVSVMIAAIVLFVFVDRRPERPRGPAFQISVLSPIRPVENIPDLEFSWIGVHADYYMVTVMDGEGNPIWNSGPVAGSSVKPGAEEAGRFLSGERYLWWVSAFFGDGRVLESPLKILIIQRRNDNRRLK